MAKLNDHIDAELENIQEVLNRLPPPEKLAFIKELELAGLQHSCIIFIMVLKMLLNRLLNQRRCC